MNSLVLEFFCDYEFVARNTNSQIHSLMLSLAPLGTLVTGWCIQECLACTAKTVVSAYTRTHLYIYNNKRLRIYKPLVLEKKRRSDVFTI